MIYHTRATYICKRKSHYQGESEWDEIPGGIINHVSIYIDGLFNERQTRQNDKNSKSLLYIYSCFGVH